MAGRAVRARAGVVGGDGRGGDRLAFLPVAVSKSYHHPPPISINTPRHSLPVVRFGEGWGVRGGWEDVVRRARASRTGERRGSSGCVRGQPFSPMIIVDTNSAEDPLYDALVTVHGAGEVTRKRLDVGDIFVGEDH